MNAAAGRLVQSLLTLQIVVGTAAFVVFVWGAPRLLLLDPEEARGAFLTTLYVAVATEVLSVFLIARRLGQLRYVLRALALGSRAFEPDELLALARVPGFVTAVSVGSASLFSLTTLAEPFRASGIDFGTAFALLLLALLIVAAAALPLYVLVRNEVSHAMELVPPDTAREVLAVLEERDVPRRRVLFHMIAAVLIPISFVAAGAALVAHAHVRHAVTKLRVDTAIALARAADVGPGALPSSGRREAMDEAEEHGFVVRSRSEPSLYAVAREPDGRIAVSVPLDEGHAVVSFASIGRLLVSKGVLLAQVMVLGLALIVGHALGTTLGDDLVLATRQVRSLGNEDVLRGEAKIAGPARFHVVTQLGRAIETLAERFRVFARAQERSIEAREATLRLRGLLFASVSHDLRSPLNAILGFCALASAEPLTEPQLESISIIERRGRELLALIETILDAARVEAHKLTLSRTPTDVGRIIEQAVARGDELGPMDAAPVTVDIDPGLPKVSWDEARIAQALGALIGHAKRLSPHGGVRVEAKKRPAGGLILMVHDPSSALSVLELGRLLDASNAATAPNRLGGLALGLSLARALIALHGGRLGVEPDRGGGTLFRAVLPVHGDIRRPI
jgi:signal transduction histidine kinase